MPGRAGIPVSDTGPYKKMIERGFSVNIFGRVAGPRAIAGVPQYPSILSSLPLPSAMSQLFPVAFLRGVRPSSSG